MSPRSSRRSLLEPLCAGALLAFACTSDHGRLAERPRPPAQSGGMSGASGSGGLAPLAGSSAAASGGSSGTVPRPSEPPGRSVFTLVHGIVDAGRVLVCFARAGSGAPELVRSPMPERGLEYGESFALEAIPGLDLEEDRVVPFVIDGELALVEGLDCEDAVRRAREEMGRTPEPAGQGGAAGSGGSGAEAGAGGTDGVNHGSAGESQSTGGAGNAASSSGSASEGGAAGEGAGNGSGGEGGGSSAGLERPRLRVAALPGLEPGTLAGGRSIAMVATGCIGGPAFEHASERDVCGAAYRPELGSLTAEVVTLSRLTGFEALALQALHASRASGTLSISVAPPASEVRAAVVIADSMREGYLRPRQPRVDLTRASYGVGEEDWSVQATWGTGQTERFAEFWPEVLERAGLSDLEAARTYTVILVGPDVGLGSGPWWNAPAFALIDNEAPLE